MIMMMMMMVAVVVHVFIVLVVVLIVYIDSGLLDIVFYDFMKLQIKRPI